MGHRPSQTRDVDDHHSPHRADELAPARMPQKATLILDLNIRSDTTFNGDIGSEPVFNKSSLTLHFIADAVGHVGCGDVARRRLDMRALIIEKEVCAKGAQELALVEAAKEQRLVDANVPGP